MKSSERNRECLKSLPEVIRALNTEVTRLTGKIPVDAIREKVVDGKSTSAYATRMSVASAFSRPSWFEREETRFFSEREISLQ